MDDDLSQRIARVAVFIGAGLAAAHGASSHEGRGPPRQPRRGTRAPTHVEPGIYNRSNVAGLSSGASQSGRTGRIADLAGQKLEAMSWEQIKMFGLILAMSVAMNVGWNLVMKWMGQ